MMVVLMAVTMAVSRVCWTVCCSAVPMDERTAERTEQRLVGPLVCLTVGTKVVHWAASLVLRRGSSRVALMVCCLAGSMACWKADQTGDRWAGS